MALKEETPGERENLDSSRWDDWIQVIGKIGFKSLGRLDPEGRDMNTKSNRSNSAAGKDLSPKDAMASAPPSRPVSRAPTIRRKPRRRAISVVSMDQGSVKLAYTESRMSLEEDDNTNSARDMNGEIVTLHPDDPQASG